MCLPSPSLALNMAAACRMQGQLAGMADDLVVAFHSYGGAPVACLRCRHCLTLTACREPHSMTASLLRLLASG